MKKEKLINDLLQGLLMASVVAMALPMPELAWAQGSVSGPGIGSAATGITGNELGPVTTLVSALFYIGGGVLMGAGALKLKQHAENPTTAPLGHGLGRLGAGAALMAIPYFGQTLIDTLHLNTATTNFTSFGNSF
jgi:hypothetical protein